MPWTDWIGWELWSLTALWMSESDTDLKMVNSEALHTLLCLFSSSRRFRHWLHKKSLCSSLACFAIALTAAVVQSRMLYDCNFQSRTKVENPAKLAGPSIKVYMLNETSKHFNHRPEKNLCLAVSYQGMWNIQERKGWWVRVARN